MTAATIRSALACDRSRCACRRPRAVLTHCPAHGDRTPSLSVAERGGRVLVRCHTGCEQTAVIAALQHRGLWGSGGGRVVRARTPAEVARAEVLAHERARLERLRAWTECYDEADVTRYVDQIVRLARHVATELGDRDDVGSLLAAAADLERLNLNASPS